MANDKHDFAREWALKWAEGCIIRYIRGTLEERKAIPMLRKAIEMLSPNEVKRIIENIWQNPVYLPSLNTGVKKAKAKELLKKLDLVKK